jgi:anti-sigma factor (TIGR02949 family)
MMGCDDALRQLWEYLDGNVEAAERDLIEEHLARCLRCCGERDFAEALRRFLASHAGSDLPGDVAQRLNQTIEELGR